MYLNLAKSMDTARRARTDLGADNSRLMTCTALARVPKRVGPLNGTTEGGRTTLLRDAMADS